MADIVDAETRSRLMSGIRATNTRPEIRIRRILHRSGFRFRLHVTDLPGKPDIVLPRFRAVVLVHGCFWHGHSCPLFKWPSTRSDFWRKKIGKNQENDDKARSALRMQEWRVATIWECAVKGTGRLDDSAIGELLQMWLESGVGELQIHGNRRVTT